MPNPYDNLAEIYDRWITGDPACDQCHRFYLRRLADHSGVLVEGGVGTGRIALDLIRSDRFIVGIDSSGPMLSVARNRIEKVGIAQGISLCRMDMLQMGLRNVDVFFLPFRTIGHFVLSKERTRLFAQVYECLKPGGMFIFDHYVADKSWAEQHHGAPIPMYKEDAAQRRLEIWDVLKFNFEKSLIDCSVNIRRWERAEASDRRDSKVSFVFSWLQPSEAREMAISAGFEIEALYGDFDGEPFNEASEQQVWVLRRPMVSRR